MASWRGGSFRGARGWSKAGGRGDQFRLGPLDGVDAAVVADGGVRRLKLLVENRVPLDQAVVLAAEAAGDEALTAATLHWAEDRRGQAGPSSGCRGLPPLLSAGRSAGGQRNEALLPCALAMPPTTIASCAQDRAEIGRGAAAGLVTVCVSGLIVLAYTMLLLGPYFYLLRTLARPMNLSLLYPEPPTSIERGRVAELAAAAPRAGKIGTLRWKADCGRWRRRSAGSRLAAGAPPLVVAAGKRRATGKGHFLAPLPPADRCCGD